MPRATIPQALRKNIIFSIYATDTRLMLPIAYRKIIIFAKLRLGDGCAGHRAPESRKCGKTKGFLYTKVENDMIGVLFYKQKWKKEILSP